jgi:hypothetical protein
MEQEADPGNDKHHEDGKGIDEKVERHLKVEGGDPGEGRRKDVKT